VANYEGNKKPGGKTRNRKSMGGFGRGCARPTGRGIACGRNRGLMPPVGKKKTSHARYLLLRSPHNRRGRPSNRGLTITGKCDPCVKMAGTGSWYFLNRSVTKEPGQKAPRKSQWAKKTRETVSLMGEKWTLHEIDVSPGGWEKRSSQGDRGNSWNGTRISVSRVLNIGTAAGQNRGASQKRNKKSSRSRERTLDQ